MTDPGHPSASIDSEHDVQSTDTAGGRAKVLLRSCGIGVAVSIIAAATAYVQLARKVESCDAGGNPDACTGPVLAGITIFFTAILLVLPSTAVAAGFVSIHRRNDRDWMGLPVLAGVGLAPPACFAALLLLGPAHREFGALAGWLIALIPVVSLVAFVLATKRRPATWQLALLVAVALAGLITLILPWW